MAGQVIPIMGLMSQTEKECLSEEMTILQRNRIRFEQIWQRSCSHLQLTAILQDIFIRFWLQVEGLTSLGLVPPVDVPLLPGINLPNALFHALFSMQPDMRLQNGGLGRRTVDVALPAMNFDGTEAVREWRSIDEESMSMLQMVVRLKRIVETAPPSSVFWSDLLCISAIGESHFSSNPTVLDIGGADTFAQQFDYPHFVTLQVLNGMWMKNAPHPDLNRFHFEFLQLPHPPTTMETQTTTVEGEDSRRSLLLWNARGALRRTFWETLRLLHRRTSPDFLLIFNTCLGAQRLMSVGSDGLDYDGEFHVGGDAENGGICCFWYRNRMSVGPLHVTADNVCFFSISLTPLR